MAKKKVSHQEKVRDISPPQQHHSKPLETMEVQSNKLQTLKSLNALLVKETFQGREQIDSLLKSKQQLETAISRSEAEKRRFQDEANAAEIQRTVNQVFVSEQLKSQLRMREDEIEMRVAEINRIRNEFRDFKIEAQKCLDFKGNEVDKLRHAVVDLEKVNVEAKDEIARSRMERDRVLREKVEFEGVYEDLKREMGVVVSEKRKIEDAKLARDLVVSNLEKEVKSLHGKIRAFKGVVLERDGVRASLGIQIKECEGLKQQLIEAENDNIGISDMIKEERAKQVVTIIGLQSEIDRRVLHISALKDEKEGLQFKVLELEKSNIEALKKLEKLQSEIAVLVEDKRERDDHLELLMGEKNSTVKSLEESMLQLKDQRRKFGEIVHEKALIEELKIRLEGEIAELYKEVSDLNVVFSKLQASCRHQTNRYNELQSETRHYIIELEKFTLEKARIQKELDLTKKEEDTLRAKVLDLEKRILEAQEEIGQSKIERERLSEEGLKVVSQIDSLTAKNESLKNSQLKAEEHIKDLKAKVKYAEMQAEKAYLMVRNTAEIVDGKGDLAINGGDDINTDAKEIQPFVSELETIKRAFKNRDGKLENVTREMHLMKSSIAEVQKKKRFWAWLSSLTTVIAAAASVTYAARGR